MWRRLFCLIASFFIINLFPSSVLAASYPVESGRDTTLYENFCQENFWPCDLRKADILALKELDDWYFFPDESFTVGAGVLYFNFSTAAGGKRLVIQASGRAGLGICRVWQKVAGDWQSITGQQGNYWLVYEEMTRLTLPLQQTADDKTAIKIKLEPLPSYDSGLFLFKIDRLVLEDEENFINPTPTITPSVSPSPMPSPTTTLTPALSLTPTPTVLPAKFTWYGPQEDKSFHNSLALSGRIISQNSQESLVYRQKKPVRIGRKLVSKKLLVFLAVGIINGFLKRKVNMLYV